MGWPHMMAIGEVREFRYLKNWRPLPWGWVIVDFFDGTHHEPYANLAMKLPEEPRVDAKEVE